MATIMTIIIVVLLFFLLLLLVLRVRVIFLVSLLP
jgi:hypothetical protein